MGKILVIRGGAIGDFILTLPAIRLLRENFPSAWIEILGYKHIVALAEGRFYADASRSIEYGPLARFFAPNADLDTELAEYFGSFQQVVSYLFDPDGFFESNLRRCGVKNFIHASPKVTDDDHAAKQLARPMEKMALFLDDAAPQLHPSLEDIAAAERFLGQASAPILAIHPGSGGERKNWPIENWLELAGRIANWTPRPRLLLCSGEADEERANLLSKLSADVIHARSLPLTTLAAIFSRVRLFVGHDSGISHIAAAVGAHCILLFGPTDPEIWAPLNTNVQVVSAPGGRLDRITVDALEMALREAWEKSF